ncbi:hypothetical protein PHYPO_G00178970 [Pangasianodon hypophthalmus]|uniref:Chemokine interleukin-8-like domain-containing protein n=1 Tax=Pangasianodon hypophthalmus TaxID=310915 RepID=A0A5N5PQ03_PANHP|nr:hypothetical protein PHYPO_G00178970 [Pangasianodon hypophthalmus]
MGRQKEKGVWRREAYLFQQTHAQIPFTATAANMAFRSVQGTLTPLLLIFCLNILTDEKTEAVNIREKCLCIRETDTVLWRRMMDFNVIDSGPHCNKVQIIIYMGSKSVCLAPNSKQGKMLQKCWKRINFNERKKKGCMKPEKVKQRPKKPKTP